MIIIEEGKIKELANIFQILSEENRIKILFSLKDEALSVSEIIKRTGLSQPLVSFHLKTLREAKLVNKYRESTFVFNKICNKEIVDLINEFSKFIKNRKGKSTSKETRFPCPPWNN
ncbi:metalloregulator ArsR/SmtB family transcription factor [Halanaerobium sp. Z-7514]|uniref:Metalloregulator ArsR/SmtB family transcription factor n=1 Tax=Halanaerobium polyolivorans TaxID=2886943 RepID=A0AAW4WXC1_9FIRM|nr:metalloregulator ArsR/SmtB family transcription factor [Halanaerobium polyolivorans]